MSSEPLFEGASDLTDPNSAWQPQMAASRGVSEEPWQQAPDSILSSLPLGSGSAYQTLVSDGDEWHLEAIDQDEQLQPFTWGLSDWTHGLDD